MKINKTTSYAIKVLQFMAKNPDTVLSAKTLHDTLSIPYQYLRALLTKLTKESYIHRIYGRNGGFIFDNNKIKISVADIINCFEGLDTYDNCIIGLDPCPFDEKCKLHEFWEITRSKLIENLKTTYISDL
jgi:Rrf2 family protein